MNDNINFRSFKEGDYETCCEWWKWWWKRTGLNPVQRALLPDNERCFIIEKNGVPIAAYFLLVFEFRLVAFTTYLVSNPEYKDNDRKEAVELLITTAEEFVRQSGKSYIFSIGRNASLIETHKKLGYSVDPKPSHEIIKKI